MQYNVGRDGDAKLKMTKSESKALLFASYILRQMGRLLEHDELIELAARVKMQVAAYAPQWLEAEDEDEEPIPAAGAKTSQPPWEEPTQ